MKMAARQSAATPSALVQAEQVLEATRRRVLRLLYERGEVERKTLYMLLALKAECGGLPACRAETDFVITVALPGANPPELLDLTVRRASSSSPRNPRPTLPKLSADDSVYRSTCNPKC